MTKFVIATSYNELIIAVADTREQAEQWIIDHPDIEHGDMYAHEVVTCDEPYRYICD